MASDSRNSSPTTRLWIFLVVILALLSFLAMRRSMVRGMSMRAGITAHAAGSAISVGDTAKFVLEVKAVEPGVSVTGNSLEKQTETVYRRTATSAKIAFDAATPIVMGKASDIHEGAVVHVTAKMGTDRVLRAEQVVVLTGYVEVK